MSEKRYYIKGNPEKELLPENVKNESNSHVSSVQLRSSLYTKPEATQLPKAFIVVFSGGEKTEVNYFAPIKNSSVYPNIKVEILVESKFYKKTDNLNYNPRIFEYAYNKVKEYKESASPELPDEFYIVTDVDQFKDAIVQNSVKCQKYGIKLIISNPCFEVWLYYSKNSDKFDKFDKFQIPSQKLSKKIKTFVNNSVKGGLNTTKAIYDIEQNIVNAEKNYQEDCQGFPTMFSTQMFRLAEKILPYLKEGNELMLQNNNSFTRSKPNR